MSIINIAVIGAGYAWLGVHVIVVLFVLSMGN